MASNQKEFTSRVMKAMGWKGLEYYLVLLLTDAPLMNAWLVSSRTAF